MPNSIFINYRRSDSQHAALALAEALHWAFADGEIFLDRTGIAGGSLWPQVISDKLAVAKVLIVVIGKDWLRASDEYGRRRIDHPDDWVRQEILAAVNRGIPLLPVTLDGGEVPPPRALDDGIATLSRCQSLPLHTGSWESHLHTIIEHLSSEFSVRRRPGDSGQGSNPDGSPIPRPDQVMSSEPVLSIEDVAKACKNLGPWQFERNLHSWAVGGVAEEISRTYEFRSFRGATRFMAESSEAIDAWRPPHHPRWENQWRVVKVRFSTWDVGCRVTQLDIDSARRMESLYLKFDELRR